MIFSSWRYLDHLANIEFQCLACLQEFLNALSSLGSLLFQLCFQIASNVSINKRVNNSVNNVSNLFQKGSSFSSSNGCKKYISLTYLSLSSYHAASIFIAAGGSQSKPTQSPSRYLWKFFCSDIFGQIFTAQKFKILTIST